MANKIKAEDLIDKDVFSNTIQSATKLLVLTKEVKEDFAAILKESQQIIQNNPFQNSADFQNYTKEAEKIKVVMKEMEKLSKEEIKLSTQVAFAKTEEAKRLALLKEQKKALNKEAAIEAKLISTVTTQYEKNRIELKKLTGELQNLKPGTKEFQELAFRAGKLKDEIQDSKDAVKAFANESKSSTAKTLFGQVGRDIADLDFKGAADKAKILTEVVRGISFNEVAAGAKNLGSTLLELGKSIFLNPLFLIAGAITAIALAIKEEYDAFNAGSEIFEKYNKQIAEMASNHKEAARQLRDLKLANEQLSGSIAKSEEDRRKSANTFTDFVVDAKLKEYEKIKEINKAIAESNKATITEQALGIGGFQLQLERIKSNEKIRQSLILNLRAETQKSIDEQGAIYREQLKRADIEYKKELEKNWKPTQRNLQSITHDITTQQDYINGLVLSNNKKIEEENQKHLDNLKIQVVKSNNEILAEDKKTLDEEAKQRKKDFNDSIALFNQLVNRKKQAEIDAQDDIIQKTEKNVDRQTQLAAAGLDNTLAYEKENLAKAELEKRKLQEEQEKRLKRQNFYKAFGAYLENAKSNSDVSQAAFKALAQTVLADTLAGAFAEGVENFQGEGTETSDSNIVLMSKGESMVRARAQKQVPGLVTALNKEGIAGAEKWFMENLSPALTENKISHSNNLEVVNELRDIKKKLGSNQGVSINWNSHDERIESKIKDGVKRTIRHVKSKPRVC